MRAEGISYEKDGGARRPFKWHELATSWTLPSKNELYKFVVYGTNITEMQGIESKQFLMKTIH